MAFSTELKDCPKIATDAKAAHTPFIPPLEATQVLGDSVLLDRQFKPKARILSPSSCTPYAHKSLRPLLSEMFADIFTNVLLIDDTTQVCISAFKDRSVSLIIAGGSANMPGIERHLKTNRMQYHIKQAGTLERPRFSRGGTGLIAVVGMSARLPGSDNVDAFFESLMDGRVQLKKV